MNNFLKCWMVGLLLGFSHAALALDLTVEIHNTLKVPVPFVQEMNKQEINLELGGGGGTNVSFPVSIDKYTNYDLYFSVKKSSFFGDWVRLQQDGVDGLTVITRERHQFYSGCEKCRVLIFINSIGVSVVVIQE